jgi:hypothetical protein
MMVMTSVVELSQKQIWIMKTVCKGGAEGDFLDLDELLKNLPYRTTKQSLQFSIRALIRRGLIEKKDREIRRGRKRRVLAPTVIGMNLMAYRARTYGADGQFGTEDLGIPQSFKT